MLPALSSAILPLNPADFLILIVDDVVKNVQVIGTMLTQVGYGVTFATSGPQAIERVQDAQPDLILLDIMMPGMSGYQVCQQLKAAEQTASIPIIFLSALEEPIDQLQAFQVGGADYITKPFQTEVVLARIEHQLRLGFLQRQLQIQNEQLQVQNQHLKQVIGERKRAEMAALRASQAKSDFLARMNHELRTPLNAILGHAQLMQTWGDPSVSLLPPNSTFEQAKHLSAIIRSGNHLLALINEVLDMVKVEQDRVVLNPSCFELQQLLEDLQMMFQLQAEQKGLILRFEVSPNVPEWITTDETKLRQILINFLSNAIKFTAVGSVVLRIEKDPNQPQDQSNLGRAQSPSPDSATETQIGQEQGRSSNSFLRFEIEDTGVGIAPDELPKVFEPFEQTAAGRALNQGTGLGMAITRKFIQLMGGDVRLESVLGKGTRFIFSISVNLDSRITPSTIIPATSEMPGPKVSTKATLQTLPQGKSSGSFNWELAREAAGKGTTPYRVLVVDETAVNRELLVKILTHAGYEIEEAEDGEAAIAQWSTWQPHLILLDLYMPGMDGYAVARQIRAQEAQHAIQRQFSAQNVAQSEIETEEPQLEESSTKIIAFTASTNPGDHEKALAAGCDDIFLKPFKFKDLLAKIAEFLPS